MISTAVLAIGLIFSLCFVIIRAPLFSIRDKQLDFTVNNKSDSLLKYKYVLIALLRIADSRKIANDELKPMPSPPNEKNIMGEKNFPKLVQTARDILTRYEKVLSKTTGYATVAYNYRLLEWLKFSMRKGGEKNETLEGDIVNIENNIEKNSGQIFTDLATVRDNQFLKTVSFKYEVEKKSQEIKNLAQLKQFGTEQDQVVGFLRSLGSTIGEVVAESEVFEMPFPDNLTVYEHLIHVADLYSSDFRVFFKQDMVQILSKLYHAISVRSHFSNRYESKKIENIRLPDTVTDKVKYTCEVMTLFNRAIEQILQDLNKVVFSNKYDSELQIVFNREKNRRIENFYVDLRWLDQLRTDDVETKDTFPTRSYNRAQANCVLPELVREFVSKYDEFIKRLEKESSLKSGVAMSDLPDAFVVYYGRIIQWLDKQMTKIDLHCEKSDDVRQVLAGILETRRSGSELRTTGVLLINLPRSLNYDRNMSEEEYLKVTTMDELNSFYKYGPKQTKSRETE